MNIHVQSPGPTGGRMTWFDANRVIAAFGVVLIHTTTDSVGKAFIKADPEQRIVPVMMRAIGELSGSEMFFVFSLFLFAFKLDRRQPTYREAIVEQMKRLLIPFVFWAVFYALFKIFKASAFGYSHAIVDQWLDPSRWASNLIIGSSQYHMHFLPTLFALMLFYPVMRAAARYPMLGLAIIPMLGLMGHMHGYLWGHVDDPMLRSYLVRAIKIFAYVGYGIAAFAIFGLFKQGIPRGESRLLSRTAVFFVFFLLLATLPHNLAAMESGAWSHRTGWAFYAHFLMPLAVFTVFLGLQHETWSPVWSRLARFTFGIYLVHPMVIDVFDVSVYSLGLQLTPAATVLLKFSLVAAGSYGVAYGLSRIPALAWTIGLGPLPWSRKSHRPAVDAPAATQAS